MKKTKNETKNEMENASVWALISALLFILWAVLIEANPIGIVVASIILLLFWAKVRLLWWL